MPFCSIRSNINTTFELCAGGTNNRKQFSGQGGKDISRKSCEFQHWEGVKERTSDHPFLLFSCLRRKGFTWHSDWTSLTSIPRFWLATSSVVLFCQTHDKFLWYPNFLRIESWKSLIEKIISTSYIMTHKWRNGAELSAAEWSGVIGSRVGIIIQFDRANLT